jgi:hypothetical protein
MFACDYTDRLRQADAFAGCRNDRLNLTISLGMPIKGYWRNAGPYACFL